MGFRIVYVRKLMLAFVLFSISFILVLIVRSNSPIDDIDRKFRLEKIEEFIRSQPGSQACKQPNLPINSPEIMKFVREEPSIDCSAAGSNWVMCEGSDCKIQEEIKYRYGDVKCTFTDLIRVDDFHIRDGESVHLDYLYKLEQSDVIKAACKSAYDKWSSVLTGVRMDKDIWERSSWDDVPKDALQLNVLMFGFDSLSRNTFIRKLPKSYAYLTSVLGGHVLKGYNIVGDGTPQALIPILTGKTELELPDTRKRIPNTHYVNTYPFIWNDYREAGYVTAFLEDIPEQGTFTYRLNGFEEAPTDHYMRPYYIASSLERRKWPKLCSGAIPRHKVMMNYIKDFFSVYKSKPKFLFGFHGELSHDSYNLIGVADNDLLGLLKSLHSSGALNNTLLVLMADHGHRFAEIRNTIQGKQEERLPFFAFAFPPWFSSKYKKEYMNFKENVNRLTTPFDIYATLKYVLNRNIETIGNRSISLFSKIPKNRNCAQAYIEPHWCACLEWHTIESSSSIIPRLGLTLVTGINNYTKPHRSMCASLQLSEIIWTMKMTPNENLLKFNKNADMDGFVPDMSAKMKINKDLYQIKVLLKPGNGIFEATITHFIDSDELQLNINDISRVNMYGSQAKCVENSYPHLRKFCNCQG